MHLDLVNLQPLETIDNLQIRLNNKYTFIKEPEAGDHYL
mgnify:CR=1 FL=1